MYGKQNNERYEVNWIIQWNEDALNGITELT